MVIFLAVFDILNHLPLVIFWMTHTTRTGCQIGSWISFFGFGSTISFTICFAHSLYHSLRKGSIECVEKYCRKYLAIAITFGLIVGSLAIGLQYKEYDETMGICITRLPQGEFDWAGLSVILIPGLIAIVGCTVYYVMIVKMLREMNERWYLGVFLYPMILIICIAPTMPRVFENLLGYDLYNNAVYRRIGRALFAGQGFLNSLAYGLSREIYGAFKRNCCPSREEESIVKSLSFSEDETHY